MTANPSFVGPSYNLRRRPHSVQRTVNLVPVPLEPGNERSAWALKDVGGLISLLIEPRFSETGLQRVSEDDADRLAERLEL